MTFPPSFDHVLIEESAEDLYERASCGYLTFLPDGRIVKLNKTLLSWLGFPREDILNVKKFQDLLSVGGRIFFETHIKPLITMQGYANEIYFELIGKDKSRLPVLTSTLKKLSADGLSCVYRLTLFNITDRRNYERELIKERDKAQKAVQAKSEFLSMMSHEIRTPMNAVIGIANLLNTTQLSPQQTEYLSLLQSSAENLMGLLNSILDFSKIEAGKITVSEKAVRLNSLLLESVRSLEGKALEKGVPLKISYNGDLPEGIVVDPIKLGQVLSNLIGNAIKFTHAGVIEVGVTALQRGPSDCTLRFEVIDSGIGIAEDRLHQIFEEFAQADADITLKYGGSGLGLAITSKLVEILGGKIQVRSKLGEGSNFSVELTLKTAEMPAELIGNSKDLSYRSKLRGLRLLIAEDNEANVYILEHLLKACPLSYECVHNGIEVLAALEKSEFDILLLDLRMPVMDGFATARKIREDKREHVRAMPIIAFSASTRNELGENSGLEDFNDCIGKPFVPDELYRKIILHSRPQDHSPLEEGADDLDGLQPSTRDSEILFTLAHYHQSLDNDNEAVAEILDLIIEGLIEAGKMFGAAVPAGDIESFEFFAHRIQSSLEMLRARALQTAIQEARDALVNELPRLEVTRVLIFELERLIEGLRKAKI